MGEKVFDDMGQF
jgi:hypothetical protein